MNPQERDNENLGAPEKHPVFQVTKLSKYLAMILFIMMPFVGGYIGYRYAPEKVIEVEKIIVQKEDIEETAGNKEVECLSTDSYFVVAPVLGEYLDSIIIKKKQNYDSNIECAYKINSDDVLIDREWFTAALLLDDNYLYLTEGVGSLRKLRVLDLKSGMFVLEDTISPGGMKNSVDSITYWSPADNRMTIDDCVEMDVGMMGKGLDEYIEYNFKTQNRTVLEEKCVLRE